MSLIQGLKYDLHDFQILFLMNEPATIHSDSKKSKSKQLHYEF